MNKTEEPVASDTRPTTTEPSLAAPPGSICEIPGSAETDSRRYWRAAISHLVDPQKRDAAWELLHNGVSGSFSDGSEKHWHGNGNLVLVASPRRSDAKMAWRDRICATICHQRFQGKKMKVRRRKRRIRGRLYEDYEVDLGLDGTR